MSDINGGTLLFAVDNATHKRLELTGLDYSGHRVTYGTSYDALFRLALAGQRMPQPVTAAEPEQGIRLQTQYRNLPLALTGQRAVSADKEMFRVRFSSEEPVERWYGTEVLDHSRDAVDLSFVTRGAPVLVNHESADQVGVIESAEIGGDRAGYANIRFSASARGREVRQDVLDGVRRFVSVGYRVITLRKEDDGSERERYRAIRWKPYEISIVGVPADETAVVARAGEGWE